MTRLAPFESRFQYFLQHFSTIFDIIQTITTQKRRVTGCKPSSGRPPRKDRGSRSVSAETTQAAQKGSYRQKRGTGGEFGRMKRNVRFAGKERNILLIDTYLALVFPEKNAPARVASQNHEAAEIKSRVKKAACAAFTVRFRTVFCRRNGKSRI